MEKYRGWMKTKFSKKTDFIFIDNINLISLICGSEKRSVMIELNFRDDILTIVRKCSENGK
jgi:hypothetical protein